MDIKKLTLDYPLVDDNLEELETAKAFIKECSDESKKYEIELVINDPKMISTAVLFALKPRINTNFKVKLSNFKGSDFVYSLLRSSHIKEIEYNE